MEEFHFYQGHQIRLKMKQHGDADSHVDLGNKFVICTDAVSLTNQSGQR